MSDTWQRIQEHWWPGEWAGEAGPEVDALTGEVVQSGQFSVDGAVIGVCGPVVITREDRYINDANLVCGPVTLSQRVDINTDVMDALLAGMVGEPAFDMEFGHRTVGKVRLHNATAVHEGDGVYTVTGSAIEWVGMTQPYLRRYRRFKRHYLARDCRKRQRRHRANIRFFEAAMRLGCASHFTPDCQMKMDWRPQ